MGMIKTSGIVLKQVNVGDNDRILTVLTASHGKIGILGKGIKSLKNKNSAGSRIFCYSEFVLKEGKDLYYLSECGLIHSFYEISDDVEKLSYAAYFAELALYAATEGENEGNEGILRLLLNTLYVMERGGMDLPLLKCAYELRLMSAIGFEPNALQCVRCGSEYGLSGFDINEGGVLCKACAHGAKNVLTEQEIGILKYIVGSDLKKALQFRVEVQPKALMKCSEDYVTAHIAHELKSLEYLKTITG